MISLEAINRVVLREVFLPWYRRQMADFGIPLPADWNPDDAELDRLAESVGRAFAEEDR